MLSLPLVDPVLRLGVTNVEILPIDHRDDGQSVPTHRGFLRSPSHGGIRLL
ncbi:Uncharacterised protein [Mycobacteroides abscessus subsp. abscessus]|nr:Uncharacterised protein [Mycobacteroides abscessus subsp. abscessus]